MYETEELRKKLERRVKINSSTTEEEVLERDTLFGYADYSQQRINEFRSAYYKFDVSKRGLKQYDLMLLLQELKKPLTFFQVREAFRSGDKNGDGVLSMDEYMQLVLRLFKDENNNELKEIVVAATGVMGAKNFFDAQVEKLANQKHIEKKIVSEREQIKNSKKSFKSKFDSIKSTFN